VYRPESEIRFVQGGNIPEHFCFGLEQLPAKGDLLFITGGEKDVMTLASNGFHAICFNSETSNIPPEVIHKLSYRFKHIVLLFDVDKTGRESSEKQVSNLGAYSVSLLLLPLNGTKEEKDVADYFRLGYSSEDLKRLFLQYLDTLYSETMSALKSCEVDFNNPPPIAQIIVSVNDVPLGTQGNLLCITGGEGTGKSNYVASIIAGAIRQQGTRIDTLGITVSENLYQKAVLFYDTEQSEVQLYKNINNLLRRSKRLTMPDYLHAYCLTGMQRKAAAILSVEKDDDPAVSVVKALKVRDGSPLDVPLMQFAWDKEAGMHVYLGEKPKEVKEKRKEDELVTIARDIFIHKNFLTYMELCEQVQTALDVKERTAKNYIRFMREKEIILKDPSNPNYFIIGLIA
jgi:hypothetical protein